MRIAPVSNFNFTRKATKEEIKQMKNDADNAKNHYEAIQDREFLKVDGGIDARLRAREFGYSYANIHDEGEAYKIAKANYADAHINPYRDDEKEARKELNKARTEYYARVHEGMDFYFNEIDTEDGEIANEVRKNIESSEEGQEIVNNMKTTQRRLELAKQGVDIEEL